MIYFDPKKTIEEITLTASKAWPYTGGIKPPFNVIIKGGVFDGFRIIEKKTGKPHMGGRLEIVFNIKSYKIEPFVEES